jgi:hypothetical protein
VRSQFSSKPPWSDIEKDVRNARSGVSPVEVFSAPAIDPAHAPVGPAASQRETQK